MCADILEKVLILVFRGFAHVFIVFVPDVVMLCLLLFCPFFSNFLFSQPLIEYIKRFIKFKGVAA